MQTRLNQNTQSFGEFVEAVRRSRLVALERLNEAVAEVVEAHAAPTADDLGRRLQERGLISDWHRRMLRQGVEGGFFIGRYRLLDELGCGGMSSVFLGRHETWGKQAAIKVLEPRRAASRSHLERFLRESRTLAALDHSHIVRVLDCGCERGRYYLVMEFVEGPTIHDLVRRGGPLPWRDAAHLAAQAAAGLHYAHGAGLVHRDVKPANILVSKEGGAKVADLGLARIAGVEGPSLTLDDGTVVGTVDYLAPEQALDSHNVDVKADVYSLGCTLFYMLAGRAPFPEGSLAQRLLKHQAVAPPVLHHLRPETPLELSRLVERMMAKNRIDRPGMDEVAATLRMLARRTSKVTFGSVPAAPPCRPALVGRDVGACESSSTTGSSLGMEIHHSAEAAGVRRSREQAAAPKVKVFCPHCDSALLAPASAVGKRAKCPKCGCRMSIDAPPPATPSGDRVLDLELALAATDDFAPFQQ